MLRTPNLVGGVSSGTHMPPAPNPPACPTLLAKAAAAHTSWQERHSRVAIASARLHSAVMWAAESDLSHAEIARAAGVSRQAVGQWIAKQRRRTALAHQRLTTGPTLPHRSG